MAAADPASGSNLSYVIEYLCYKGPFMRDTNNSNWAITTGLNPLLSENYPRPEIPSVTLNENYSIEQVDFLTSKYV